MIEAGLGQPGHQPVAVRVALFEDAVHHVGVWTDARFEEIVVRLDERAGEPALSPKLGLDRRPGIRHHPAEIDREAAACADRLEKGDVLAQDRKGRRGIEQHEPHRHLDVEVIQQRDHSPILSNGHALVHQPQPVGIARFHPEIHHNQPAPGHLAEERAVKIVDPAGDLPLDPLGQASLIQRVEIGMQPCALAGGARGEIIVLEEEDPDPLPIVEVLHLIDDALRRARSAQRAAGAAIELADAAEGAVEQAAPAGQHRCHAHAVGQHHRIAMVESWQAVQICDERSERGDNRFVPAPKGETLYVGPALGLGQRAQKLDQGFLAFETDDAVEVREQRQRVNRAQAGEMPARGEMGGHAVLAQGAHEAGKLTQGKLEDQREPDHSRLEGLRGAQHNLGAIAGEGDDFGPIAICPDIGQDRPQAEVLLLFVSDQQHIQRRFGTRSHESRRKTGGDIPRPGARRRRGYRLQNRFLGRFSVDQALQLLLGLLVNLEFPLVKGLEQTGVLHEVLLVAQEPIGLRWRIEPRRPDVLDQDFEGLLRHRDLLERRLLNHG